MGCGCGKNKGIAGTGPTSVYQVIRADGTIENEYDTLLEARAQAATKRGSRVRVTSKKTVNS